MKPVLGVEILADGLWIVAGEVFDSQAAFQKGKSLFDAPQLVIKRGKFLRLKHTFIEESRGRNFPFVPWQIDPNQPNLDFTGQLFIPSASGLSFLWLRRINGYYRIRKVRLVSETHKLRNEQ